ncbi:hypothetical protein BDF22DRAFT_679223 [Syncephalis plumigaleata]|nr:hypothetical protein BDF22DRAFT_679223 [Syncephalis plumigaleata]
MSVEQPQVDKTHGLDTPTVNVPIYSTNAGQTCSNSKGSEDGNTDSNGRAVKIGRSRPPLLVKPTSRLVRSQQPTDEQGSVLSPFKASNTNHSSRAFINSNNSDQSSSDLLLSMPSTEFEYSVHGANETLRDELSRVFPFEELAVAERNNRWTSIKIIMTFQRCRNDLVGIGPQVELEKDERLETFFQIAESACRLLIKHGYWADFTDPSSGYPVYSPRGPTYFPDVVASELLLGYDALWTGCCKVLIHPRWDAKVYPASIFSNAPVDAIKEAMDEACGYRSSRS